MASFNRKLSELSKDGKQLFLSAVRSEFLKSPLASNVFLGLILTGLEKVVDVEFACPCDPKWNAAFASVFFILPGFVACVLMLLIQGCNCKVNKEWKKFALIGSVPIIMWLVLVFLDGQYYACARTNWTGRFVIVDKAEPQRWCEPTNSTSYREREERMSLTQTWYFHSQYIGILIPLACLILFGGLMLCMKKPEEPHNEEECQNL